MLPKDELLRNIDELYESYISAKDRISQLENDNAALEAKRARLITLNAALRQESSKQIDKRDTEISALKAEISPLRETITAQNAELSELRRKIAEGIEPGHIPALSPLDPEFLRIEDTDNTGGPDAANFWQRYVGRYPSTGLNDRYKFYIGYLFERKGWRVIYNERDKRIFCVRGSKIIAVSTEDGMNISHNTMYTLIGSALKCKMDNMNFDVSALCVTSKTLTQGADIAAKIFSVSAKIHFQFANFPYVKCKALDNRRVCYTPLNKEYFTVQIDEANGDMFALTVDDAVANGFRPV